MRRTIILLASSAAALLLIGAIAYFVTPRDETPSSVFDLLRDVESFELFSIDPERDDHVAPHFHGWRILGSTVISDEDLRDRITQALRDSVNWEEPSDVDCFDPRHGVRFMHEGKTIDVVICFECYKAEIYEGKKVVGGMPVRRSTQPLLDGVLKDANVRLPGRG